MFGGAGGHASEFEPLELVVVLVLLLLQLAKYSAADRINSGKPARTSAFGRRSRTAILRQ